MGPSGREGGRRLIRCVLEIAVAEKTQQPCACLKVFRESPGGTPVKLTHGLPVTHSSRLCCSPSWIQVGVYLGK